MKNILLEMLRSNLSTISHKELKEIYKAVEKEISFREYDGERDFYIKKLAK